MNTRRQLLIVAAAGLGGAARVLAAAAGTRTPMGERLMAFLEAVDQQDLALNPQAAVQRGDLRHAGEFGDLISDGYYRAAEALLRSQLRESVAHRRLRGLPRPRDRAHARGSA